MKLLGRYILILIASFCVVYFFRFQSKLNLGLKSGQRMKIKASLTQEPILQGSRQTFKIKGITVKTRALPEYHYGDRLLIVGTVKTRVINSIFNRFWLINPQISKLKADSKKNNLIEVFLRKLFKFRSHLETIFNQTLVEPQASLLMGIFLGIQKSMPLSFYEALKTTGTLHIIVASGMNISLTAGILLNFLSRFLGRKLAIFISLICILIYCLIAGMSPPIVRAGLMAAILYLANLEGRESLGFWTLFFSAGLMLLFNPFLLFDVGFQLSFSATLGLMVLAPFFQLLFQKKLAKLPEQIRGDLSETISAQIFAFPILAITFGRFNPLSILPNALVLFLIPYLMFLGLLISISGLVFLPAAQFFSWLAYLPLTYFIQVINFFGRFSFFNLKLEGLSWLFGLGYYLILLSLVKLRI